MKVDYVVAITGYDKIADLSDSVNDFIEFNQKENNAIAVDIKYQTACPNPDSVVHFALILFTYIKT